MNLTRSSHPPLSEGAIRRYFEARFSGQRFTGKIEVQVICPFHHDSSPSMSLNLQKAVAFCHAGCGGFGLLSFEKRFSNCDDGTAWTNIAEIAGEHFQKRPEKIYVYEDEFGRPLFRVIRDPRDENGKKGFRQQKYLGAGNWAPTLLDARRVLYHLPDLVIANEVLICEGEKDADAVRALDLAVDRNDVHVCATTNPGGAGKWLDAYSPYLAGKRVFILPDNDEVGRAHAEQVAQSVSKFAAGVKIVTLPDLPPKGDVSDFLKSHSAADLIAQLNAAKVWQPSKPAGSSDGLRMFVDTETFLKTTSPAIEWAVGGSEQNPYRGVIQRGTGGFILGLPKAAKSYIGLDLCISLALGSDWLGKFKIPQRMKCAIVSREDYPGMTRWRFERLLRSKPLPPDLDLGKSIYWNTRFQTPSFLLDRDEDLEMLIEDLQKFDCEFLLCDVFRRLHLSEENSNDEMQILLERISRIQNDVKCAIAMIHHTSKELEIAQLDSIFRYARGASAIHGWMEWGIGLAVTNPERPKNEWTRRVVFENKAGGGPDSILLTMREAESTSSQEPEWIRLEASPWVAPEKNKKRTRAAVAVGLPYKDEE